MPTAQLGQWRPAMTGPALTERLRDAGLSAWELGDLLGIHPHLSAARTDR